MDHYGLLTLTRQLNSTLTGIHQAITTDAPKWQWRGTPVFYPESHCPFCKVVIRSNGIWFFSGPPLHNKLYGAIFIGTDPIVKLIQPSHPHETGGGHLCLGRCATGIELLSSTPNLNDSAMGRLYIPKWLKRYWNRHTCKESIEYISREYECSNMLTREIREIDAI